MSTKTRSVGENGLRTKLSVSIGSSASYSFGSIVKNLFANGELGVAYNPNDFSTLFQDSFGLTSVTNFNQPIGLRLDLSKNLTLGQILPTDGTFSNPLLWTTSVGQGTSISNNKLIFNNAPSFNTAAVNSLSQSMTTGRLYKISLTVSSRVSGSVRLQLSGGAVLNTQTFSNNGSFTYYVFATASHNTVGFQSTVAGTTMEISNLSIREIFGNHSSQSTASLRPILRGSPTRIEYDGIDDVMLTSFPSQITGCTVAISIPNVGCQISTNQTIPSNYFTNTNNCGLIIVNRALTNFETYQITKLFNSFAGV